MLHVDLCGSLIVKQVALRVLHASRVLQHLLVITTTLVSMKMVLTIRCQYLEVATSDTQVSLQPEMAVNIR